MPAGDKLFFWNHGDLKVISIEKETAKQWQADGRTLERVEPNKVGCVGFAYYCTDRDHLLEVLITHQERLAKVALDEAEKIKLAFAKLPR